MSLMHLLGKADFQLAAKTADPGLSHTKQGVHDTTSKIQHESKDENMNERMDTEPPSWSTTMMNILHTKLNNFRQTEGNVVKMTGAITAYGPKIAKKDIKFWVGKYLKQSSLIN